MINNITKTLSPLFEVKTKAPTTLFEFSYSQSKRKQSNFIHLTGILRVNGQTLYAHMTYGSNISISNKNVVIDEIMWYQYLNLEEPPDDFYHYSQKR